MAQKMYFLAEQFRTFINRQLNSATQRKLLIQYASSTYVLHFFKRYISGGFPNLDKIHVYNFFSGKREI